MVNCPSITGEEKGEIEVQLKAALARAEAAEARLRTLMPASPVPLGDAGTLPAPKERRRPRE